MPKLPGVNHLDAGVGIRGRESIKRLPTSYPRPAVIEEESRLDERMWTKHCARCRIVGYGGIEPTTLVIRREKMRIAWVLLISRIRKVGESLTVTGVARFTQGRSGRSRLGPTVVTSANVATLLPRLPASRLPLQLSETCATNGGRMGQKGSRQRRIWGRRPSGIDPSHPINCAAFEPCQFLVERGARFRCAIRCATGKGPRWQTGAERRNLGISVRPGHPAPAATLNSSIPAILSALCQL